MHNVLAIETSSALCSIALQSQTQLSSREAMGQRSHTQHLLPFVDEVLAEQQLAFADLDAIAFSAGPGPFTGIRLAASVAKSLAYAANKPVITVSSLAAIAQAAYREHQVQGNVLVITDARMDELYVGEYGISDDGQIHCLQADALIPLADFEHYQHQSACVLGDAWSLIAEYKTVSTLAHHVCLATASDVIRLANIAFQQGKVHNALDAQAVYLRDKTGWKTVEQQQEKN